MTKSVVGAGGGRRSLSGATGPAMAARQTDWPARRRVATRPCPVGMTGKKLARLWKKVQRFMRKCEHGASNVPANEIFNHEHQFSKHVRDHGSRRTPALPGLPAVALQSGGRLLVHLCHRTLRPGRRRAFE